MNGREITERVMIALMWSGPVSTWTRPSVPESGGVGQIAAPEREMRGSHGICTESGGRDGPPNNASLIIPIKPPSFPALAAALSAGESLVASRLEPARSDGGPSLVASPSKDSFATKLTGAEPHTGIWRADAKRRKAALTHLFDMNAGRLLPCVCPSPCDPVWSIALSLKKKRVNRQDPGQKYWENRQNLDIKPKGPKI